MLNWFMSTSKVMCCYFLRFMLNSSIIKSIQKTLPIKSNKITPEEVLCRCDRRQNMNKVLEGKSLYLVAQNGFWRIQERLLLIN